MKKFFVMLCCLSFATAAAFAQNKADDIIGNWFAEQDGVESYVAITKSPDGTEDWIVYHVK